MLEAPDATVAPPTTPEGKPAAIPSTPTTKELRRQAEVCREERKELIVEWSESVGFHCGEPFAAASTTDRIPINKDWPRVKARVAMLCGQMPEVRLLPKMEESAPAVPVFAKALNDTLARADTFEAVYQALVDNTATAGVGVVMVSYQKLTDMVPTPLIDMSTIPPEMAQQLLAAKQIPMEDVETTTDVLFSVSRLSPSDLLWPTKFPGFNFDKADWIGRSGEMGWSEAQNEFGLTDDLKEQVLGEGKDDDERLRQDGEYLAVKSAGQPVVEFDEIFYWAYRFDPKEKYFKKIRRIVFVKNLPDPVIHEDWAGQQFNEQAGTYVGACRFPIRVLKVNYVSDQAIPPSESVIGRPQVLELMEFRTDQHESRKRGIPTEWVNTNKVDPETLVQMMQGTWKGRVPINGRGEDALGEVGRSHYPPENQMFEKNVNHDLDEVWQSGANQSGTFASGERSASEARIVQSNFDMRNGLDRTHVAKFVQGIAEVMAGLVALFGDFDIAGPADQEGLATWDRTQLAGEFVYEVIPDSMVRLDAHQQIGMLMDVLNMVGKSGFVNPAPFIAKICALSGMDEKGTLTQPQPPPPPALNISIRSAEDLHDPLMLALLASTGQLPTPEHLLVAQKVIASMVVPLSEGPPVPPSTPPPAPGAPPMAPEGTATSPEGMTIAEKISKRSDYGS